ncbi:MAG TPA: GspH/FimT family pseudopilin [Xanthomonadaceae bacterium]|nr:GspH/FimT family pseudopilin [Xanthomonadaceae bacterium]
MRNAHSGFTLLELMIAVAVVAILFAVAIPALANALEAARAGDARSGLLASLTRAVSRAAITGRHAVLCPSGDALACDAGQDWSGGWIAFLDRNGNREREADETVFFHQGALAGKVRLRSTVGRTRIVIQPSGGNAGSNVTFTLCDGRGPARAQTLVISNRGRIRYGKPSPAAITATCPE